MIMVWLVILSMLVIAAYTAAVCVKQRGVPYSISATFYAIEHKGWFRFTMWGLSYGVNASDLGGQ